jgi:hypothetical protein
VSDLALKTILHGHASESCRPSLRCKGTAQHTLEASVRSVCSKHPFGLAYRTINKRIRRGRLGIVRFKQQHGKCDICHSWRFGGGSKPIASLLKWFKEALATVCTDYMKDFDNDDNPYLVDTENGDRLYALTSLR